MNGAEVDMAALGRAIRRRRERRGWTSFRLAEKAGVSDVYLGSVESGITKRIGIGILSRLAMALDVTVDDLLRDAGIGVQRPSRDEVESVWRELDDSGRAAFLDIGRRLAELQADSQVVSQGEEEEEPEGDTGS